MGYIYKITNKVNNKIYIGKTTKTIEYRFSVHIKNAKKHINRYLYDAMNCYGYENFYVEEIEECDESILNEREIFWIKYYNSTDPKIGYNMTIGGDGGDTWTNNSHKELTIKKSYETKIKNGSMLSKEDKDKLRKIKEREREKLKKIKEDKDKEILLKFMYYPYSISRFCKETNVSQHTLFNWCNKYFNCTPNEIRKVELIKKEYTKTENYKYSHQGYKNKEDNPNYKEINIDKLKELIIKGFNREQLAKYFEVSKTTISHKVSEYFGKELRLVRRELLNNGK